MQVLSLQRKDLPFTHLNLPEGKGEIVALWFSAEKILRLNNSLLARMCLDESSSWSFDFPTDTQWSAKIHARQEEIQEIRESFRAQIQNNPPIESLESLALFKTEEGTLYLPELSFVSNGISGTYLLLDLDQNPKFVIKPFDEEAGCINSPKTVGFEKEQNPFREAVPLYHSAQRETLGYRVAQIADIESIVPKTSLVILYSDTFHLYYGYSDREKLCSVQEYVAPSKTLFKALHEFQELKFTDEEIEARIDQKEFEEANLLLWLTYDTDGHSHNFLCYPKELDSLGHEILGLRKIDNGLAFPDKNVEFRNALAQLPNAKQRPSPSLLKKIASLNVELMAEEYRIFGLDSAIPALQERVPFLQRIAATEGITLKEINQAIKEIHHEQSLFSFHCISDTELRRIDETDS